ncbi:MAG: hypothetical protein IKX03_00780, partial [Bacteroidales bacterium]|nr:hypothetical protein [Bacteroidales bacterium]
MKYLKTVLILAAIAMLSGCSQPSEKPGNGTKSYNFEGQIDYDALFTSERLRIEFILAGDAESQ